MEEDGSGIRNLLKADELITDISGVRKFPKKSKNYLKPKATVISEMPVSDVTGVLLCFPSSMLCIEIFQILLRSYWIRPNPSVRHTMAGLGSTECRGGDRANMAVCRVHEGLCGKCDESGRKG